MTRQRPRGPLDRLPTAQCLLLALALLLAGGGLLYLCGHDLSKRSNQFVAEAARSLHQHGWTRATRGRPAIFTSDGALLVWQCYTDGVNFNPLGFLNTHEPERTPCNNTRWLQSISPIHWTD